MKQILFTTFIIIAFTCFSQTDKVKGRFGCAVNSSLLEYSQSVGIAPTATYFKNNHQLELGIGIHPFEALNVRIISLELNYMYFANGISNRFNLYFITNFTSSNKRFRSLYDEINYNYLILTGGYGFQFRILKDAYVGTDINAGGLTRSKTSDNPNYLSSESFFHRIYLTGMIRLNIGYRF